MLVAMEELLLRPASQPSIDTLNEVDFGQAALVEERPGISSEGAIRKGRKAGESSELSYAKLVKI